MIRLFLSLTLGQYEELVEHLRWNGYHFDFVDEETLDVDEEEIDYVKTILQDQGISFTEQEI